MSELSFTCPPCGQVLQGTSEEELIRVVREHARVEHQMELSAEDVRRAMAQPGTT